MNAIYTIICAFWRFKYRKWNPQSLNQFNTTAVVGLRYLTPYLFDVRVDNELRPRIALGRV
jgi:hypothetical protein